MQKNMKERVLAISWVVYNKKKQSSPTRQAPQYVPPVTCNDEEDNESHKK